jgi:predicted DNA binding protein
MNYQSIHDSIIDRAKTRVLPKETYTERHHIIPRCMNGSDDKSNLVDLTAKEHFIVHKLLVEIYPDVNALWNAYYMMMTVKGKGQERNYHITAEEFNRVRIKRSKILSERVSGDGNPSKRPEVRLKQSLAGKNKTKSKEHRESLSKSRMGIGLGEKRPEHSKVMKGEGNPKSKLTEDNVRYIRAYYKPYSKEFGMKQLAEMFGVSVPTIDLITRNKIWTEVV